MSAVDQEITGVGAVNQRGEVWLWLWEQDRRGRMTGIRVENDLITIDGDFPVAKRYPQQVVLACSKIDKATVAFVDDENNIVEAIDLPVEIAMPA